MKIGSETRRQEDNRHRHLHRQADTYSEKDMIRGETTKRKSKERERERENVKEKKILKPNRDIQSLERINNNRNFILLILTFFTIIQKYLSYTNLLEPSIIKSLIQLFEFILINPLRSRPFSLSRINNSTRFPARWIS